VSSARIARIVHSSGFDPADGGTLVAVLPDLRLSRQELLAQRAAGQTEDVHFTETLAEHVIRTYSRAGDVVLDPFAGFGTSAVVAVRLNRRPIAIELLPERADLIRDRLGGGGIVVTGDARKLATLVDGPIDLCLTSPPYMAAAGHPENPLTGYRTLDGVYQTYLDELEGIARQIAGLLRAGGHLVLNVATIQNEDVVTPLAQDIGGRVARHLALVGDIPILWDEPPPGIVSDHCLVFRRVGR
jgi:DNA modification methylase